MVSEKHHHVLSLDAVVETFVGKGHLLLTEGLLGCQPDVGFA